MKLINFLIPAGALVAAAGAGFAHNPVSATDVPKESVTPYVQAAQILAYGKPERLRLRSQVALIMDEREGVILYERAPATPRPIASLTKLMTALVVLESSPAMDEGLAITQDDRDRLKGSHSRIPFGTVLTRAELLRAALGASDNRAASALARNYPGGSAVFVAAMNAKAQALDMTGTRFADASGLAPGNVSTARDLLKLLDAARREPLIHSFTTSSTFQVTDLVTGRSIEFVNTNRLVRQEQWEIALSKTGYTADAGNCLVMQVTVAGRPLSIVLLNSWGRSSKYADAKRIRDWLIDTERRIPLITARTNF